MFSIGALSKATGVKVPTIRYYEEIGLLPPAGRNAGNQRRYGQDGLEALGFIKHARDLGFALEDIKVLMALDGELGGLNRRDAGRASARGRVVLVRFSLHELGLGSRRRGREVPCDGPARAVRRAS